MTAPAIALRATPRPRLRLIDGWSAGLLGLVLGLSALILALLAIVLWLSFREGEPGDPAAYYTVANYTGMLGDAFTWQVLGNTLQFSMVTLAVSFLFGLPAAWLVERTDIPGKPAIYTVMTIGLLLPGFASAMGWLFLLHPRIGLVNTWLQAQLGLASPPFNVASLVGMGWVQGLNLAPVAFIMTAAVFRAMDPSLEESASTCGASTRQVASRVTLPLAWPGILAAGIYVFTIGFAAFDVPAIIGWANRLFTFSTYLLVLLQAEELAAALRRGGGAVDVCHCSRRAARMVVRPAAEAGAPLSGRHRQGIPAAADPARSSRDHGPGPSSGCTSCLPPSCLSWSSCGPRSCPIFSSPLPPLSLRSPWHSSRACRGS